MATKKKSESKESLGEAAKKFQERTSGVAGHGKAVSLILARCQRLQHESSVFLILYEDGSVQVVCNGDKGKEACPFYEKDGYEKRVCLEHIRAR